jgi:hypothetical protein
MELTPQSIRNNVFIKLNGEYVKKEHVIELSKSWNDKQISYFRKMLKQGGSLKINGDSFKITINENIILNSRGEKDGGIITIPGIDERF